MQGPDLEFEDTSASGIVWSGFISLCRGILRCEYTIIVVGCLSSKKFIFSYYNF